MNNNQQSPQQQRQPGGQGQWQQPVYFNDPAQPTPSNAIVQQPHMQAVPQTQSAPPVFQSQFAPPGQHAGQHGFANHHTTSTTTTTTTTSHGGHQHTHQYAQQPMAQLTGQMSSMTIQQSPVQQVQSPMPQLAQPFALPGPPTPVLQAPPTPQQQIAPLQPVQQVQAAPQPSKYSITVDQRTWSYRQWLSTHDSKPQKAKDRMHNEYMSGQRDQQIYESLVREQQTLQTQTVVQTQQVTEEQKRKARNAAANQRRQERQLKKAQDGWQTQQTHRMSSTVQTQQATKEQEKQARTAAADQRRQERQSKKAQDEWQAQQSYQTQSTVQSQHVTKDQERQARTAAADQRRQERQQKKASEQAQAQQVMMQPQNPTIQAQGPMMQAHMMQGASGAFGETTTTTTTVDTTTILQSQAVSEDAGQHRREAISQGTHAVRALDQRIQIALRGLSICPAGFQWVPIEDGYLCCGGNHFIPDKEIDKLLNQGFYQPRMELVNQPEYNSPMGLMGPPTGFSALKKPPDQLPRWHFVWQKYNFVEGLKREDDEINAEEPGRKARRLAGDWSAL